MDKVKVCLVTLDNPVHHLRDGIAVAVEGLARGLVKLGLTVYVVGLSRRCLTEEVISRNGICYWCIPNRGENLVVRMLYFMRVAPPLLERLAGEGVNVFHGQGGYAGPVAAARLRDCRRIATLHTTYEEDRATVRDLWEQGLYTAAITRWAIPPPFLMHSWRRWYFSRMDRIISITQHNAKVAATSLQLPVEKFVIVPNAVDCEHYSRLRRELQVSEEPETVLFFGRLAPRKGVQVLLRSVRLCTARRPRLRLRIVGDGPYKSHLLRLAHKLGLEEAVDFQGFKEGKALVADILAASVVVIPSLYEGLPFTLLEAMALGKAVVSSNLPGIDENVVSGTTGILVPPADEGALASALEDLFGNAELRTRLGNAATDFVRKHRDWDLIARKTLEVYQDAGAR